MSSVSATQHGQNVLTNSLDAIKNDGGASIEAELQAVFALAHETNTQALKSKVQEYRAKLTEQQKINQALAEIERYKAGFKGSQPNDLRDWTEGKEAAQQAGAHAAVTSKERSEGKASSYETELMKNTKGTPAEKQAFVERARIMDMAERYGMDVHTLNHEADATAFIQGHAKNSFVDAVKAKLKATMDALGADSQLQMIDIQTVKGRMDAALNALTTVVKSDADTKQKLSNNL